MRFATESAIGDLIPTDRASPVSGREPACNRDRFTARDPDNYLPVRGLCKPRQQQLEYRRTRLKLGYSTPKTHREGV